MKKILFQDTTFRDGFQSYFGARALTDDFLDAVRAARKAGITHFEAGGGARFQSVFLYCGESAYDMMDKFYEAAGPGANLQTLARGISVVALEAQPRDMIDLHAKTFKRHYMTHIRNFDALNDVRNLTYSGEAITKAGLHHQVVITMMEMPPGNEGTAHTPEFYIKTLKDILDSGLPYDSICFKDSSGVANPKKIYDTVKEARKILGEKALLWIHTHDTAGSGVSQYKAAIEAGINGVCLARAPLSGGTSQPDLLSMWHVLKGTEYTLDIDVNKILEANSILKHCLKDYFFPPEAMGISPEVLFSPMPGGALTANTMMMRDNDTLHLYPKVIEEMAECIAKGGYGTSVTPVSQFYFQQAYANVTLGKWKKITDGYGKMVLGYFGRTPVTPDAEIIRIASEQLKRPVFDGDPLDLLEPGIPKAKEILEANKIPVTEENLFIIGAFQTAGGNKGLDFLQGKLTVNVKKVTEQKNDESPKAIAVPKRDPGKGSYVVTVGGKKYDVLVEENSDKVTQVTPKDEKKQSEGMEIKTNLSGNIYSVVATQGARVKKGDILLIIEAMKMENSILSPADGVLEEILVHKGDSVRDGQTLAILKV
ncbi:MAG: biotin attachment protein [Leptospiraceae bacterium]|nr:biotin/lipoyl-binding protein [Leptospiraceae bacterium]MCP5510673.1 biotin attachment protein [Leptospiraceae bacterium]